MADEQLGVILRVFAFDEIGTLFSKKTWHTSNQLDSFVLGQSQYCQGESFTFDTCSQSITLSDLGSKTVNDQGVALV